MRATYPYLSTSGRYPSSSPLLRNRCLFVVDVLHQTETISMCRRMADSRDASLEPHPGVVSYPYRQSSADPCFRSNDTIQSSNCMYQVYNSTRSVCRFERLTFTCPKRLLKENRFRPTPQRCREAICLDEIRSSDRCSELRGPACRLAAGWYKCQAKLLEKSSRVARNDLGGATLVEASA